MSWYLRKSIKAGPFRFNLSKSGIGVSGGIPGLRVGSGPRGHYIHAGKGGLYYRKTLTKKIATPGHHNETQNLITDKAEEIESADTLTFTDASSQDLLEELNNKLKQLTPYSLIALSLSLIALFAFSSIGVFSVFPEQGRMDVSAQRQNGFGLHIHEIEFLLI